MKTEQYDLPNEEWRDLVSYPQTKGVYWISNLGRYKRLYKGRYRFSLGSKCEKGYRKIDLHINNQRVGVPRIHDLVAEAFIRPLRKGEVVHHISGVTYQNNLQNLKIMSRGKHTEEHSKGNHYKLGKKATKETRKRMSLSRKGKKHSSQSIAKRQQTRRLKKLADPNYGKRH